MYLGIDPLFPFCLVSLKKLKRPLFAILAVLLLVVAGFLAKPVSHLIRIAIHDGDDLVSPAPGYIDDASRLNETQIAEVFDVPVDSQNPEGQIAELLRRAQVNNLRVSVAGAKHSMGGHTIYPGGIVINMIPFNHMELDEARNILKVQAGALWKDILLYLDQHGRSVSVMQSNNSFSVGGSISVNCHGWQYNTPPIASTVGSFRIMLADGTIISCSRRQNQELFSLALGGYGLFGIILDVELQVVPNERYRLEQYTVPLEEALVNFGSLLEKRPDVQMAYGRMNIVPDNLFSDVILNAYSPDPEDAVPALSEPGMTFLRRTIFRGSAESDYGKELRWSAETKLQPLLPGKFVSRNQLLNEGVEVFQNRTSDSTDILHEYFVPKHRAVGFVDAMRNVLTKHGPNLLNVTVRSVNQDHDTFLRYADQDMIAFVMLFVQDTDDQGEKQMEALTRDLIDKALEHEGRYYLPYRLHATSEQFYGAYPQARDFFNLKRKYDPGELFQNQFYLRYAGAN